MPEPARLSLFVTSALLLLVTPGPAVLYIVARSMDQGRLAGLVSSAGLSCGGLVHVAVATLGLSALLGASTPLVSAVQYAGAAYLLVLGLRTLVASSRAEPERACAAQDLFNVFRQGVVVNLLNPKSAMFLFAFLPQFVDASSGSVPVQILTLGLIFVALGIVTDAVYALVAGTIGSWLRGRPGLLHGQRVVAGAIYVALGLLAAIRP